MEKAVKIFSALSDMTRLRIYFLLLEEEHCVYELGNILNMEQSRISHSLKILREAGLIRSKREGKWIFYSVDPKSVENEIIQGLIKESKMTKGQR